MSQSYKKEWELVSIKESGEMPSKKQVTNLKISGGIC